MTDHHEQIKLSAHEHIALARATIAGHPNLTRAVSNEPDKITKMLNEGTFYTKVTDEEMKQVVQAMEREFMSTGHWYRCENGHPFTIGECGRAMSTSRCPQCGVTVGGQQHQLVEGNTSARDLEELFGQMRV